MHTLQVNSFSVFGDSRSPGVSYTPLPHTHTALFAPVLSLPYTVGVVGGAGTPFSRFVPLQILCIMSESNAEMWGIFFRDFQYCLSDKNLSD